jgi:hypothetical protein
VKNKSIKIILNYVVGPLLFLWLSVSIFHQLKAQPDLNENLDRIQLLLSGEKVWYLITSILLVCLNWGLEARKWQLLLLNLESISFFRSFKATLSGVAFALNTPNRIGEYGGRVLYLKEGNRLKAVSLTIVGSVSQLLVTLLAGLFGMLLLRERLWSGPLVGIAWAEGWFSGLLTTASLLVGLFYFRVGKLLGYWRTQRWFKGLARWLDAVEGLSANLLLELLALSFLRYMVFVIQYVLVLRAVGLEADLWTLSWMVTVFFLWLSIGPTIALLELGLRWEYSLLLFGMISSQSLGIYTAATLMWLINLVFPALIGSLLMLGVRLFRKTDNLQV